MAYELRGRRRKCEIFSYYSDEETDTDSTLSDPDYVRTTGRTKNKNTVASAKSTRRMKSCANGSNFPVNKNIVFALKATQRTTTKTSENGMSSPGINWKIHRKGRRSHKKRNANTRIGEANNLMPSSSRNREEDDERRRQPSTNNTVQESLASETTTKMQNAAVSRNNEGTGRTKDVVCSNCNKIVKVNVPSGSGSNNKKKQNQKSPVENTRNSKTDDTDSSDDACLICADGGDLLCCDKCPSTFHPGCLGLKRIPLGKWFCPFCVCKYCRSGSGRLLMCLQCEKQYHWKCFGEIENIDLNRTGLGLFCGSICKEVYAKLEKLIGVKHELKGGYSWKLIRHMNVFEIDDEQIRSEINIKIVLAWRLLNECFMPLVDRLTGIEILPSVVRNKGSGYTRLNFRGFYTVILEKGDTVVSAATIRVHGNQLADMPFIATRESYRHRGCSRMLLNAIEHILSSLEVKHLVIPSIPQVANMWQEKFGFSPIDEEMKTRLINFNTLMFPCSIRLQKNIQVTSASTSASPAAMDIDKNDNECKKLNLPDLNRSPPESEDETSGNA